MQVFTPILITGAAGFVGANLLRRVMKDTDPKKIYALIKKDSDCWRISDCMQKISVHAADLSLPQVADRLIASIKPKTIFHLATHGGYPSQQYDEEEIMRTNVIGVFNLVQSCMKIGFDAFVNTGTSSEYGIKQKPMRESDILKPLTAYGVSKSWATLYCQHLALTHEAPIITLRPFSVYGPYEPKGRLIPNIVLSFLAKTPLRLASPRTARDLVYVDDMVDAYLQAAHHPRAGTIFNIGSGHQTTILEVFSLLRRMMHADAKPLWDTSVARSFDTARWVADIRLAKTRLKWKPKTDLTEGLQRTAQWFTKNLSLYET